jgi:hypothetical protein
MFLIQGQARQEDEPTTRMQNHSRFITGAEFIIDNSATGRLPN